MRKGFLWAATVVLASSPLAQAQSEIPTAFKNLPDSAISQNTSGAPDLSKPGLLPPQSAPCCDPPACRPLGIWVTAEYLLWWSKDGPVSTPLVTTGPLTAVPPGALGQPGTRVLFGDHMNYGDLSGMRLGAGIDIADGLAIEGNFFLLQNGSVHFRDSSNGLPVIGHPFFNTQLGVPDAVAAATNFLGVHFAGTTAISSASQLQGWELNLANRYQMSQNLSFVAIGGFRSLNLNEDLYIQDNLTPISPGALLFKGMPISAPSTVSNFDYFHTGNTFYGGQVGGRLEWQQDRFSVAALGKVGLGVTQQVATVDGGSALMTPGAPTSTAPGGVYALPSNMGRYYHSTFSVVPEAGLTLGYQITPRIKATFGYTFIFWNNVARPGEQIDRNLNPSIMPTNQAFGTAGGGNHPSFSFQESSYWAQGINFGLEFKF